MEKQLKILFATSEAHPLIKTGGLADVSHGLPLALHKLQCDVRLILPAYPQAIEKAGRVRVVAEISVDHITAPVRLLEGRLPGTSVPVYLVDAPAYFARAGNPYLGPDGRDWQDNAHRFSAFGRAIVEIAMNRAGLDWRPDTVHCNDWQTGLVPALLHREAGRPTTIFTIHNLAYQGVFSWETFAALGLPKDLWSADAMEFYGRFSFIKGGLAFADQLTTVSPTYAREIRTSAFGYGLEGLLDYRRDRLTGILNGIDYDHWNPNKDPFIPRNYGLRSLEGKQFDKAVLQERMGLVANPDTPVLGLIGRFVEQKGFDLLLAALPALFRQPLQVVVLGSGETALETAFRQATGTYPGQLAAHIGYDEELAHLIESGSDMFLMPSRFEPCGLNQIYSLRYGTVPIVHRTGGLADSIVDADPHSLKAGTATGFQFQPAVTAALISAVERALTLYADKCKWRRLVVTAMKQDFSWRNSAQEYLSLYQQALQSQEEIPGPDRL